MQLWYILLIWSHSRDPLPWVLDQVVGLALFHGCPYVGKDLAAEQVARQQLQSCWTLLRISDLPIFCYAAIGFEVKDIVEAKLRNCHAVPNPKSWWETSQWARLVLPSHVKSSMTAGHLWACLTTLEWRPDEDPYLYRPATCLIRRYMLDTQSGHYRPSRLWIRPPPGQNRGLLVKCEFHINNQKNLV